MGSWLDTAGVFLWGVGWIQEVRIKCDVNLSVSGSILLSFFSLHIQFIPNIEFNQCATRNSSFFILMHMLRTDIDLPTSVCRILNDVLFAVVVLGEGVECDAVNSWDTGSELSCNKWKNQ